MQQPAAFADFGDLDQLVTLLCYTASVQLADKLDMDGSLGNGSVVQRIVELVLLGRSVGILRLHQKN